MADTVFFKVMLFSLELLILIQLESNFVYFASFYYVKAAMSGKQTALTKGSGLKLWGLAHGTPVLLKLCWFLGGHCKIS